MTETTTSNVNGGPASAGRRRVVHKYPFNVISTLSITLVAPRVVHVGIDPAREDGTGYPCVWIEHVLDAPADDPRLTQLEVKFIPTGVDVGGVDWQHAGSVVIADQGYVWHIYSRRRLVLDPGPSWGTVVQP